MGKPAYCSLVLRTSGDLLFFGLTKRPFGDYFLFLRFLKQIQVVGLFKVPKQLGVKPKLPW